MIDLPANHALIAFWTLDIAQGSYEFNSVHPSVTPLPQDWLKRFSDFSHEARIHKHKCDKTHFLREILMPKIEEMPKVKIFELSSKSIH